MSGQAPEPHPDGPDAGPLDVLIVGCGPIGLACAAEAIERGLRVLAVDKGCLVNSIYHYPTAMRFFSTPEFLEIGGLLFVSEAEKPSRGEALEYCRRVTECLRLPVRLYEEVLDVAGADGAFDIETTKRRYRAANVIVATGFFDCARMLNVPGEELPKVSHYFREAHPYARQDVLVVGSGNSAAQAALACYRHGARVTVALRRECFAETVRYWIRPNIENRIARGEIVAHFCTQVREIRADSVLLEGQDGRPFKIPNDFVLAMTGYEPNYGFLGRLGIAIGSDAHRTPAHDPKTYETNRRGIYLAGVVVSGRDADAWSIENSRIHAGVICDHLATHRRGAHC